ncbi:sensor histidine kinase [Neolewinella persica]|uniref:sensor histidine kinase n=1 Tax=Neolewinella persica TaxID=70998 RepID=UPI000380FFF5|nr:sensor histidine kinase [Neolewinella persica]
MEKWKSLLSRPIYQHLLFWLVVYTCYIVSNWSDFTHPFGVFSTYTVRVVLQIGLAYACLLFILPRYLANKNTTALVLSLVAVVFTGHFLNVSAMVLYLEPTSPEAFLYCRADYMEMTYWERVFDLKYAVFITPASLFPPTFVLVAIQYYQKQQQVSELNEQKRAAELSALKHQLNPHFLFNTLNNLYTLALKKSDQTAVAIARLSDILDHILYRCNEPLVALDKELDLIESYIGLEKIRYGKRVEVTLKKSLAHPAKISPLLLLTFIENAFKHGVSQEVNRATVDISLASTSTAISFRVSNSIPSMAPPEDANREAIGLSNIRRQLELTYPNRHKLTIRQTDGRYDLTLNLQLT